MDHRVTPELEEELLAFENLTVKPDGEDWEEGVRRHFGQRLCAPAIPDSSGNQCVTWSPANVNNAIPRGIIARGEQLLHAGSLGNSLRFLSRRDSAPAAMARLHFEEITGKTWPASLLDPSIGPEASDPEINRLGQELSKLDPAVICELAGVFSHGFGATEPPWWATFAEEVVPLVEAGDGTGLCRALGLGHIAQDDWLFVWRYGVGELEEALMGSLTSVLMRPTVAEATVNPWHFVSPPGSFHGITMPLDDGSTRALREVLHPPLKGALASRSCTGRLLQVADAPGDFARLHSLRLRHRARLEEGKGGAEVTEWLARHAGTP